MKILEFTKDATTWFTHVFYCEPCKTHHGFNISNKGYPIWTFNGDLEKPTINPSILVTFPRENKPNMVCHSFVTDGKIQYLSDCTHELAGQTIELSNVEL